MIYPKHWSFQTKEIAKNFDKHVRQSVPMYDEIQSMVAELVNFYTRDGDNILDLGCSTGNTLANIKKEINKKLQFEGYDNSLEMLAIAEHRVKGVGFLSWNLNAGLPNHDGKYSAIISLFTMQFVKMENRQNLISDIYSKLRKGGVFIMFEKIQGNNAHFNEMFVDLYQDMKVRQGLSPADNLKKSQSLRGVMNPITTEANENLLFNAGFIDVDMFYKWYNFAGFIAVQ